MKMRITFALLGGMLLSMLFTSTAAAEHVGFTINGQPGDHECVAPCTIEVADPDGGSYDWDFEYNHHSSFLLQASGNPVSWTYSTPEVYRIVQTNGSSIIGSENVYVIPADEAAPEDIELKSPASGVVPRELEFTTSRRKLSIPSCGGSPCRTGAARVTGPDGNGLYHHFVRLEEAPPQGALSVEAWNTEPRYAVEDTFPITTTGRVDPFTEGAASWKARQQGGRCVVKFSKGFSVTGSYKVELKLLGKVRALRVGRTVRNSGPDGTSRVRGKLVLRPLFIHKLPGKAIARLKVTVDGKSYFAKDKRTLKPGCR